MNRRLLILIAMLAAAIAFAAFIHLSEGGTVSFFEKKNPPAKSSGYGKW